MDVALVQWPAEAHKREMLAEQGTARLLLVDEGHEVPEVRDCLEDWVRVPATEAEVLARVQALSVRQQTHCGVHPDLDEDGVLRFGGQWVSLPPVEAQLARALLARFTAVVSRESLTRAGWPQGGSGRNALDVHVLRLRRRIAPLGLAIRTVRCRGYLLEASDIGQERVRNA